MTRIFKYFLLFLALSASNLVWSQDFTEIKELIAKGEEDRALALLASLEEQETAIYLNFVGEANLYKGNYEEALDNFDKAMVILEQEDPESEALAMTYSFVGITNMTMGNATLALQYLFRSLNMRRTAGNEAAVAGSLNDVGLVYARSDQDSELESALMYYEEAADIYIDMYGETHEKVSTAYVNIGLVKRKQGKNAEAIDYLDKALEIRQRVYGTGSIQEAFVRTSLGAVYADMGDRQLAREEFEISLSIYQKQYGPKHPEVASIYNLIGDSYFKEENSHQAIASFQKALIANVEEFNSSDAQQNPKIEGYDNADVLLISLLQKARSFEQLYALRTLKKADLRMSYETLSLCDELIDDIRQFRNSEADKVALGNTSTDVYETAIRVSLGLADASWKKKEFREKAFYYADKSKSAVLLASIADANAKSFAGIPTEIVEQEKKIKAEVAYYEQKLAEKPDPDMERGYRNELLKWTTDYHDFIAGLEMTYPTYYNLKHNSSIPGVSQIQDYLADDIAVLSYFVGYNSQRLYLFLITKKNFKIFDTALSDQYDRNISGYRNAMYYDAPNTYKKTARDLYTQLLPGRIPSGVERLIVIPSGRMATIPFEALITQKIADGDTDFTSIPYLINDYVVSYQYAASLLLNPSIESAASESIALFAPVDFTGQRLSELPGSEVEVNDIASLFAGSSADVDLFLNQEATTSAVMTAKVEGSKYLHFATHGIVDEDRPENSQICLAPTPTEDGRLYSGDIYNLQLSADLVVLSACETGLGKISRGEGIIGLTRALIFAGSNNLLVSLWRVGDASTSLLMTDFYRAMLQGNDYTESLRLAKKGMIESGSYASPYYWAPFVLIGQ